MEIKLPPESEHSDMDNALRVPKLCRNSSKEVPKQVPPAFGLLSLYE